MEWYVRKARRIVEEKWPLFVVLNKLNTALSTTASQSCLIARILDHLIAFHQRHPVIDLVPPRPRTLESHPFAKQHIFSERHPRIKAHIV